CARAQAIATVTPDYW
nr:immunoglobulin heavy chain junction region [Macaca mulatta]